MKSNNFHEPVMTGQVIKSLHLNKQAYIIDATLGTAGHTKAILDQGAKVLGIEVDPKMLKIAQERVPEGNFVLGNFVDIDKIAKTAGLEKVDGILFDLGVSNLHLKADDRGFSFSDPSQPLDMRLNTQKQGVLAKDLLNALDETQLTNLFLKVMKYKNSKILAKKIVEKRPLENVGDFTRLTAEIKHKKGLDPSTLPLLALRIAVNSELENLKMVLPKAFELLKTNGRILVITFHSGEVEIVKKFDKRADLILPTRQEIEKNPRARSAKLWVITKK